MTADTSGNPDDDDIGYADLGLSRFSTAADTDCSSIESAIIENAIAMSVKPIPTTPDLVEPADRIQPCRHAVCRNERYRRSMKEKVFRAPIRHKSSATPLLDPNESLDTESTAPLEDRNHPEMPGLKPRPSTRQIKRASLFQMGMEPDPDQVRSKHPANADENDPFVTGFPLWCLIVGLMLAVFLVSIDRTIISTAIPYITQEFKSTPDIGWYGSAYLLTACAFQPVYGRVFMLFSIKKSYLLAMFIFELGSLLCGLAQNSTTLIAGRAIAGFGSAGVLTGSFVVVSTAVPLRWRPIFIAVVGLMFGVGASVGPLLGGVFTDLVTWRWCFYINIPIGGTTVAAMVLYFNPKVHRNSQRGFLERVLELDMVGNALLLGATIMLFLALEYATQGVPWSSAKIIGLLTGWGVVGAIFITWEIWKGEAALMPPRILSQRTVAASCGMAFMTYGAIINLTFFLPVWFQAIHGDSAIGSGINMIPYFVVNAFFSLLAGIFVASVGYVTPPAVIGSAIGTVGLGILTLLDVETTTAQWIGYEVLASAGFGMSIQQGFTAVQTVLDPEDMAVGTAAVVAAQSLGGAIFLTVGNGVFQNQLLRASVANKLPGVDIKSLIDMGAASFRELVPVDQLPILLQVYNGALQKVFMVGIPLGAMAAILSCLIEFKSVRKV